jgi:hypothetical protein
MAISQGLGRILESTSPQLAIYVNPFDVDARVRYLGRLVGKDSESLDKVDEEATSALSFNPIDARLFGVLGTVAQLRNHPEEAYLRFTQARALSRTELSSVQSLIGIALQRGEVSEAVQDIDTMLRRRPDRFSEIAPFFLPLLRDEEGYTAILDALAKDAPWRSPLVRQLSTDPEGLSLVERLLGDLAAADKPARPTELAMVLNGLVRQGQHEQAYRFFLFTLSDEEKAYGGYVYNSTFAPVKLARRFDWQYADKPGVEVRLSAQDGENPQGAHIRFLNAPIKEVGIGQTTMLPPGKYQLVVEGSGTNLSLPKGLFWVIDCVGGQRAQVAKSAVPEGSFRNRRFNVAFSVPDEGCPLQQLRLSTDLVAVSWRFRYQGEFIAHSVRIEKASE